MSWWWHEQGIAPADTAAMSPSQRLAIVVRYWREVADGWVSSAPKSDWVGTHDPFSDEEIHSGWHPPLRL